MKPEAPTPAFQPLYAQIKLLITERLESGEWRPGEPIPSEIELAQRFSVSQGTVRKAVNALAEENVLVRRQGRGTFVASHASVGSQLSFLRISPDDGEVEALDAELVDLRRQKADVASARQLGISAGASLLRLRRTLTINHSRVIFEEVRLPCELFKGLGQEVVSKHRCMLYSMYELAFHIKVVAAQERVKAASADTEIAQMLKISPGAPVMVIDRIAYTYGRKPVELRRAYCNTSKHHYANAIS